LKKEIKIKKYGIIYAFLFVIVIILLNTLALVFEFDNSGNIVGALFTSAGFTISKFVKDNKRIPSKIEKSKLIWISIIASWLIIILFTFSFSMFSLETASFGLVKSLILLTFILFYTLFMFCIVSFLYGFFATRCLNYYEGIGAKIGSIK